MILLLGGGSGIVDDAEDGAVRDRTQSPLPVVVVGNGADGTEFHGAQQGVERDIELDDGAGSNSNAIAQRRQERWCRNLDGIEAGQEARGREVSRAIGED